MPMKSKAQRAYLHAQHEVRQVDTFADAGTTTDPKLDITHAAGGGATHPGWQQSGGWW